MAIFLIHWRLWYLAKVFNSCPAIILDDFIVHMEAPMTSLSHNLLFPRDLLLHGSSAICMIIPIIASLPKSLTRIYHSDLTSSHVVAPTSTSKALTPLLLPIPKPSFYFTSLLTLFRLHCTSLLSQYVLFYSKHPIIWSSCCFSDDLRAYSPSIKILDHLNLVSSKPIYFWSRPMHFQLMRFGPALDTCCSGW